MKTCRPIDVLIWSKDRACQLDLLLRSIKDNFDNYGNIFVRYDYSNEDFKKGYEKIKNKIYCLPLIFLKYKDLETDTKYIINKEFITKYMVAICDDDVFINHTNIDEIMKEYKEDVCAISLRMSKNITWCYGTQKSSPLPKFEPCGNFLKWKWTNSDPSTDWGYPSAVNIHIYRTDWYREVIKNLHFDTPNKLEYLFNTNRKIFKPYIISFNETKVLNIPVNQVQKLSPTNPYGKKFAYTRKELNDKFLNGYAIDTKNIYGYNNHGVNEEIELHFVKEK